MDKMSVIEGEINLIDKRQPLQSLATKNLLSLIRRAKRSSTWAKGDLIAIVLMNKPHKQVVFTLLHEDSEIISFQRSKNTTFQVIEGGLTFDSRNRSVFIEEGQQLTLHDKQEYSLTNELDTAFLLTTEG